MIALSDQIAALASRGRRLRQIGGWLTVVGLCFGASLFALHWPDPVGDDALYQYMSVPQPLFTYLQERGAGVRGIGPMLLPGGTIWWTVGIVPLFVGLYVVLRKVVKGTVARRVIMVIIVLSAPFWLLGRPSFDTVPGARIGIIVDRGNAPPAAADGTSRPTLPAYHLTYAGLPRPLADQARFVLAQQAYLERDASKMATNLEGLSGQWRPAGRDRLILGLMLEHAAAKGFPVRNIASSLTAGEPHSTWRRTAFALVEALAILCCAIGAGLYATGDRRLGKVKRYDLAVRRLDDRHESPEFVDGYAAT